MRQTDFVILGLLSESPLTGYQIKKVITARFSFFWHESFGQLYPALKSLKQRALIEEVNLESLQNHAQITYRITADGTEALKQWLHEPPEHERMRLGILLKMYFSGLVPDAVTLAHLKRFQEDHEKDLNTLKQYQKELQGIIMQHANHARVLQVIDFGIQTNKTYLQWCKETIALLKEGEIR